MTFAPWLWDNEIVRCNHAIFAKWAGTLVPSNPVLLCTVFSFLSPSSSSLYLIRIDKKSAEDCFPSGTVNYIMTNKREGGDVWHFTTWNWPVLAWLWDRVVTGMVAQEILDACEEAAAATGGGGGSSETNLANPALGRYPYRSELHVTVRYGKVWCVRWCGRARFCYVCDTCFLVAVICVV